MVDAVERLNGRAHHFPNSDSGGGGDNDVTCNYSLWANTSSEEKKKEYTIRKKKDTTTFKYVDLEERKIVTSTGRPHCARPKCLQNVSYLSTDNTSVGWTCGYTLWFFPETFTIEFYLYLVKKFSRSWWSVIGFLSSIYDN